MAKLNSVLRGVCAKESDKRLSTLNEIVHKMSFIKMFALEDVFSVELAEARR
jgi:hypothetical protein